jgi:hypothetical protein
VNLEPPRFACENKRKDMCSRIKFKAVWGVVQVSGVLTPRGTNVGSARLPISRASLVNVIN